VSSLLSEVAHNWRAPFPICWAFLSSLACTSRRSSTPSRVSAALRRNQSSISAIANELQSTTPNPPKLRSYVLIEEVPVTSERLRSLARRAGQTEWTGNVIWLLHRLANLPAGNATCGFVARRRSVDADRPHVVARTSSPSVASRGFKRNAASSTGRPITSHMTP